MNAPAEAALGETPDSICDDIVRVMLLHSSNYECDIVIEYDRSGTERSVSAEAFEKCWREGSLVRSEEHFEGVYKSTVMEALVCLRASVYRRLYASWSSRLTASNASLEQELTVNKQLVDMVAMVKPAE